jgi:hypothetical protein
MHDANDKIDSFIGQLSALEVATLSLCFGGLCCQFVDTHYPDLLLMYAKLKELEPIDTELIQ